MNRENIKVRLGEVCTVVSGSTPKSNNEEYWGGNNKWITPAELKNDSYFVYDTERHITEKAIKDTSLKLLPKGTVLLSSRAPIGKVAIVGNEMFCNQGFKNLVCSQVIDNKYLFFFLKYNKLYLEKLGRGATFKELSKTIVENIEISLPDKNIQVQNVKVLEKIDCILALLNKENQLLDELVQSRFIEMFGDQNNSLGFPIKTVEELANVKVGLVIKPTRFYNDIHRDVKALRGVNIKNGKIKDDNWVFFSNESNKINFRTQVHKGDVVVVRTGDPGQSAVVTDQFNNCNAIDLLIATPDTSRILPSYLSSFTNFSHGREQIKMSVGGAAQKHFNVSKYESMKVFLPSMDLQRSYELFLKSVDKSKLAIQKSIDELEILKKSLMQEYFG